MKVTRYKPQAVVTFYTEQGELVARATNDPKAKLDDDVLSIQTTRDMGADAPTFSITLTRRKQWDKWITSNDLIKIEMQRPPEANKTVLVGIVDDVRKKVSLEEESISRVVTITGRGVAKAFIQFDVGVVPEGDYIPNGIGWIQSIGVNLSGSTASEIIKGVWEKVGMKLVNYRWDNLSLFDLIQYDLTDRENMRLLDDSSVIQWQGSLWAFMKEIAEEPWYELYWEIGSNNVPTMVMRPTPFNPAEWSLLTEHEITDEDVMMDEIGRSDVETYTLYSVGAKTLFSPNDTYKTFGQRPYWYKPYADKYGIRRLHAESAYMSVADSSDADLVDRMRDLMKDLYNWNILNNAFFNGNLIVKGSNQYKIGDKLVYTSDEDNSVREYYIKSVTHNFVNFSNWVTQLGVTRGAPPATRYRSPVDEYTEYDGTGLLNFNPAMALSTLQDGSDTAYPITGAYSDKADSVVRGATDIMNNGINGVKVKYTFGGNNPTKGLLDCSSFVQYVYKTYADMDLGRSTGTQVKKGSKIDKSDLQPGDLVFFKDTYNSHYIYGVSHVGIYIGGGQFINNSSGAGTIVSSDLDNSYWQDHWLMGRRVLQPDDVTADGTSEVFEATAYGASKENLGVPDDYVPTYKTATGTTPLEGRTIAVDPSVIPLGSRVRIVCDSYPSINGEYIAEDTGGAIKGRKIDIYFNDIPPQYDPVAAGKRMKKFGRRKIKVTILQRG